MMENIKIVSKKEYRRIKSLCNAYERTWRKKNPAKHKLESKTLLKAIVKKTVKPKSDGQ